MKGKIKRLGIVLSAFAILYLFGFIDFWRNTEELSPWIILNIPLQVIAGVGSVFILGVIGVIIYSCIYPFIKIGKWIVRGGRCDDQIKCVDSHRRTQRTQRLIKDNNS